ncbi:MAG: TIM barrel protein [Pseudomonadota bacterium]
MSLSANLGFLWTDLSLPDAIHAAADVGFDAVECHWPYAVPSREVAAALSETGLPMLGLNTPRGNVDAGENGLSALAGREVEARDAIDQALHYADAIGAQAVHVMAGFAEGNEAQRTFEANLRYACDKAESMGTTILIEPLNPNDAPGYFLKTTEQARDIIETIGSDALRLMFDCYHVGRTEGDVTTRLERLLPIIGHIQIASVPDRGPPDEGELSYAKIFDKLIGLGWNRPVGAEYKPQQPTPETLGWMSMKELRRHT